jgi:hypothetical protein
MVAQIAATSAPGDRYFGKLRMSTLRIRYETMQLKKRYETHELLPEDTEHLLRLTDDAFREWARRYPRDAWLPSTGLLLAQLYKELPGNAARDRAIELFVYVKSTFPASPYARMARDQLHRGVPAEPYPAWANAKRTPAASPASSIVPSIAPSVSPSPTASS